LPATISRYKHNNPVSYTLGMSVTLELLLRMPEAVDAVFLSSNIEENENTEALCSLCERHRIPIKKNDKAFNIFVICFP